MRRSCHGACARTPRPAAVSDKADAARAPAAAGGARICWSSRTTPRCATFLREALEDDGYAVEVAAGGRAGVERVRQGAIDLVVSDVKMPDLDGLDMLREIKAVSPSPHVITITAFGSIDTAIRAVKLGAFDYITKPFEVDQLIAVGAEGAGRAGAALGGGAPARRGAAQLPPGEHHRQVGADAGDVRDHPAARRLVDLRAHHRRVGDRQGAGRQGDPLQQPAAGAPLRGGQLRRHPRHAARERAVRLQARRLHRRARPIAQGLFVEADGGTIFLDEIAELSPALQAKLLRVLQEREIRPLGAARSEKIDVRVIAATNRDLEARLRNGEFPRGSLLPAERHPDPPAAAARSRRGHPAAGRALPGPRRRPRRARRSAAFTKRPTRRCSRYGWPGNVRELENVVERAVALAEARSSTLDDLPPAVRERRDRPSRTRSARRWPAA